VPPVVTTVVSVSVLLALFGSGVVEVTVAVFVSVPVERALTLIVRVAVVPGATVPIAHVTVLPTEVQPALGAKLTPAGRVSVIVTPVAGTDPAGFVTVRM